LPHYWQAYFFFLPIRFYGKPRDRPFFKIFLKIRELGKRIPVTIRSQSTFSGKKIKIVLWLFIQKDRFEV